MPSRPKPDALTSRGLCASVAKLLERMPPAEARQIERTYSRTLTIVALTNDGAVVPTPQSRSKLEELYLAACHACELAGVEV